MPTHSVSHVLLFRLGDQRCAIASQDVDEIVPIASTVKLPGQPSILDGFLDLRGEMVPIVQSGALFGLSTERPGAYTPFIILHSEAGRIGLIVDSVEDVIGLSLDELQPVDPQATLNGCVKGQFQAGESTVTLFDFDRILLLQERRRIEELTQAAARRIADVEANRS